MSSFETVTRTSAPHACKPRDVGLQVTRPSPATAVIEVGGVLDGDRAHRLQELLLCRLRSTLRSVVVDLTAVTFLGEAGARVLARANLVAEHHRIGLRILIGRGGQPARTLAVAELTRRLPVVVSAARNWPPGPAPGIPADSVE
jgi:anti-anti-sigma factor